MERIRALVDKYRVSQEVELQQRAVEYRAIFTKHDGMRYLDICTQYMCMCMYTCIYTCT